MSTLKECRDQALKLHEQLKLSRSEIWKMRKADLKLLLTRQGGGSGGGGQEEKEDKETETETETRKGGDVCWSAKTGPFKCGVESNVVEISHVGGIMGHNQRVNVTQTSDGSLHILSQSSKCKTWQTTRTNVKDGKEWWKRIMDLAGHGPQEKDQLKHHISDGITYTLTYMDIPRKVSNYASPVYSQLGELFQQVYYDCKNTRSGGGCTAIVHRVYDSSSSCGSNNQQGPRTDEASIDEFVRRTQQESAKKGGKVPTDNKYYERALYLVDQFIVELYVHDDITPSLKSRLVEPEDNEELFKQFWPEVRLEHVRFDRFNEQDSHKLLHQFYSFLNTRKDLSAKSRPFEQVFQDTWSTIEQTRHAIRTRRAEKVTERVFHVVDTFISELSVGGHLVKKLKDELDDQGPHGNRALFDRFWRDLGLKNKYTRLVHFRLSNRDDTEQLLALFYNYLKHHKPSYLTKDSGFDLPFESTWNEIVTHPNYFQDL